MGDASDGARVSGGNHVHRQSVLRRAFAGTVAALVVVVGALAAAPASATAPAGLDSGVPPVAEPATPSPATEATIVDMVDTSALFGGTVASATAQTPYPTTTPTDQRSVTTAQIILDDPATPGTQDMSTYCIDLNTDTTIGVHYELGTWSSADVPNLPYVQWILDNYYPKVPTAPAGGSDAEKVRAVQGAIWYFTDQFVVSRFYPAERAGVRAIVEAAQAALAGGTPPAPPLPTLEIAPASIEGALPGDLVGPFAVSGTVSSATIDFAAGVEVYSDAGGTVAVAAGSVVVPGTGLWVRYDADLAPEAFTLAASATVPAGNVFLYNGGNPPRTAAQKLVLAADTTVPIRATGEVLPPAAGTGVYAVDVEIAGAAAGDQGTVELTAECSFGGEVLTRALSVPAGSPAGTYAVATVPNLPAGTTCALTPVEDGGTPFASVTRVIDPPAPVTIVAGATTRAEATYTYSIPVPPSGALRVLLTVDGAAAGQQSALQLRASCTTPAPTPATISRTIDVPAGFTGSDVVVATVGDLPAGAECSVIQTVDGRNARASLSASDIEPASVTIPAGAATDVVVTDTYVVPAPPTGAVAVDVTIAGEAAGQQGAIGVTITCTLDGVSAQYPAAVAAGATGTVRAATIVDVEAESTCAAVQTADGANARAVLSSASIEPASVVIAASSTAVLGITDTFAVPAPAPTPTPTPTPTPHAGPLPATGGADVFPWAGAGLITLMLGIAAIAFARRRRAR